MTLVMHNTTYGLYRFLNMLTLHFPPFPFPSITTTPPAQELHFISIDPWPNALIRRQRLEAMNEILPSRISEQSLLAAHRSPLVQARF